MTVRVKEVYQDIKQPTSLVKVRMIISGHDGREGIIIYNETNVIFLSVTEDNTACSFIDVPNTTKYLPRGIFNEQYQLFVADEVLLKKAILQHNEQESQ